jgi:hypothetical protein
MSSVATQGSEGSLVNRVRRRSEGLTMGSVGIRYKVSGDACKYSDMIRSELEPGDVAVPQRCHQVPICEPCWWRFGAAT